MVAKTTKKQGNTARTPGPQQSNGRRHCCRLMAAERRLTTHYLRRLPSIGWE